jgi:hypothetical protein
MVGLVSTAHEQEATYEHIETDCHQSNGTVLGGMG